MRYYIGNCINLANNYFSDATEMAQLVENAVEITWEEFSKECIFPQRQGQKYYKAETETIMFLHDEINDVHHFFEGKSAGQ